MRISDWSSDVCSSDLAGLFAAAARIEWIPGPWSQAIWPILASMFMFRLIVYLYDMRQEKASFARSVSYFFMLPNVCFPMFPVVDYKGFRRSYYDIDEHRIYQIGFDWMVRGILHLDRKSTRLNSSH